MTEYVVTLAEPVEIEVIASDPYVAAVALAEPVGVEIIPIGREGPPGADGTAAVIAHEAAADPHPQYATDADLTAEANARSSADAALTTALAGKAATVHGHAIADVTGLQAALDGKVAASSVGAANGVAALDAGGKVPTGQLPAIAPESTDFVPEGSSNLYHTAARVNALIAAAVGVTVQAFSSNLVALAGQASQAFGRGLLNLATAAALRTAIALPTTTVAGRLARYTDTAGAQGQTSGLFEDASGNVGIGTTSPGARLQVGTPFPGAGGSTILYGPQTAVYPHAPALTVVDSYTFLNIFRVRSLTESRAEIIIGATSGGATISNNGTNIVMSNVNAAQNVSSGGTPNQYGFVGGRANRFLDFYSSGVNAFVIDGPTGFSGFGLGADFPVCRLEVNGAIRKRQSFTVATLPAASLGDGIETYVTDSNATLAAGHGNVVAGGGSNYVPVFSRGGQWFIG